MSLKAIQRITDEYEALLAAERALTDKYCALADEAADVLSDVMGDDLGLSMRPNVIAFFDHYREVRQQR